MAFRTRNSHHEEPIAEMNVIPLVDIVLVLLIIFMLTAPLLQRTIDIRLPRAKTAMTAQEERHMITITSKGIVYVDDQAFDWDQLEELIRERAKEWHEQSVYIRADAQVSYEKVVRVLDIFRRYGVTKIGLMTKPWVPEQ